MTAFYNEIDSYAAQWLRNLIAAGHIAPGVVDERSIEDIEPAELDGYTQCHFFAGIGVWSLALRRAGWSDDQPVWTGSCPCQPFSSAGKGAGFDDERHLWPAFHHLIEQCRPPIVLGEQVASKDADPWIDLVQADLEALGYSFGAVPFPSASIGAPHIRDRLYWVADTTSAGLQIGWGGSGQRPEEVEQHQRLRSAGRMAHHDSDGCQPGCEGSQAVGHGQAAGADCGAGGLADTEYDGCGGSENNTAKSCGNGQEIWLFDRGYSAPQGQPTTGPTNGFWGAADWLLCRDGKWRPVEPGTFPLAHGATARVGRLRAYGNAINAIQAQIFIEAYLESQSC